MIEPVEVARIGVTSREAPSDCDQASLSCTVVAGAVLTFLPDRHLTEAEIDHRTHALDVGKPYSMSLHACAIDGAGVRRRLHAAELYGCASAPRAAIGDRRSASAELFRIDASMAGWLVHSRMLSRIESTVNGVPSVVTFDLCMVALVVQQSRIQRAGTVL
jgi:hypothetical protein